MIGLALVLRRIVAVVLAAASTVALGAEGSSGPIPVLDFARAPRYSNVQFAPDGVRFGALQIVDGRANLTVGDLNAAKLTRITSFKTFDVGSYQWISNSRLVLTLTDHTKGLAELRGGGLYAINADGSEAKELSPMAGRQTRFVRRIPGSEDEILAVANERDIRTRDLYRLNTRTGKKTLLVDTAPGQVSRWVVDANNVARAAVTEDERAGTETFWYRDSVDSPWKKIGTYGGAGRRMEPATFDSDGLLWVFSNLDSDTMKLYTFDASTGKPGALVYAHPVADVDTAQFVKPVSAGFKIVGMHVHGDKPETVWFDDRYAKLQALMDVSLPKGNVNNFDVLENGKVSIRSFSDRDPGVYYLYDPKEKRLEEVLRPQDWIQPEQMSPMTVVRYKARDGLEIPAYLTLPVSKSGKKLPLVAVIHGGPWARDEWGFNPDVQFLASRGYAVFQPNYRGSEGYGLRHLRSGYKQLGETMQDDITDGIRYLIAQGIVDPDRVCIDGASYGGYATMMGLIKEPDMFKCGIDEAGVVDLFWWQELGYTDFNSSNPEAAGRELSIRVGDTEKDNALLKKNSPRLHADKVKAPVMIIHAVRDQRVPFQHAEAMRDALKAAGKPVEWVVYPDEAHGFIKLENRVDRYNKIEAFLRRNLGP